MQHHAIRTAHFHGLPTKHGVLADFHNDPFPTLIRGFHKRETPLSLAAGMSHYVLLREGTFILTRALPGARKPPAFRQAGTWCARKQPCCFRSRGPPEWS